MGDVGRRLAEIWRVLKPAGLYQGTMLSKRDAQFGRGRPVAPDTFIRGSDPKAHPHYVASIQISVEWNQSLIWPRSPGFVFTCWLSTR